MIKNNYYVVEYSHSQHLFHLDPLDVSIHRNLRSLEENTPNDWITIGIFETQEEASEFYKKMQERFNSYD